MTAAILTRLPLEAGGAVLAVTGRAVHSALAWGFARYMKAPLASTGIAAMLTLSLMATSNALYFQHTRHPAPLFSVTQGGVDPTVAPVVPAPRPVTKKAAVTPKVMLPKVETTASVQSSDTPIGNTTKVDLEGEFPPFPGMPEADELAMIDGFFTAVFAEDTETLRTWS